MKNTTPLKCVIFLLLISFNYQTSFSQDLAQSIYLKSYSNVFAVSNTVVIKNAILEDGKYTYKFNRKDILVEIKNGIYYEYHPNKEYIKAKIDWISEYEYKLTIVDMEKRGVPFKVGSELTSKITKVEKDEYHYTSFFRNKTAKGSFRKVN